MTGARSVLALLGGSIVACSSASPPPRLVIPKAAAARCHEVGARGDPIVADFTGPQRAQLDAAMKRGVAVVAYRCGALRVIEGCAAAGDYAFVGIRAEDQLVQLESPDEVQANLPFSGARLGVELASSLVGGKSLDIGLVPTGKWTTTRSRVDRADLEGTGCEEATHFVIGTTVGVAAMKMASEASDASGVFEAADGGRARADACRGGGERRASGGSPLDLGAPAPGCEAPLVLHLDKLGAGDPRERTEEATELSLPINLLPVVPACPADLVSRTGKCASPAAGIGHLCDPKDTMACRAQCEAGHLGSCNNLAASLCPAGESLITGCKGKALQEAFERSVQGCEAHVPEACVGLAAFPEEEADPEAEGAPSDPQPGRALQLNEESCDGGSAAACEVVVGLLRHDRSAAGGSPRRDRAALRGCKLGSLPACARALADTTSAERALPLQARLCYGGELAACRAGGTMILVGLGLGSGPGGGAEGPLGPGVASPSAALVGDVTRAMALFRHGCTGTGGKRDLASCTRLGELLLWGEGIPKDAARAASLYQQACDLAEPDERGSPCLVLGRLYAKGEGVGRDIGRAAELYERACAGGGPYGGRACLERGLLVARGDAGARDLAAAATLFERGCIEAGLNQCRELADALAEGGEAPKDPEAAILVHTAACELELERSGGLDAPVSCLRAGDLITAIAGKKKDPRAAAAYDRAARFYATECNRQELPACFQLASMLRKGDKLRADPARARAIVADVVATLQTSCDSGDVGSCLVLADRILRGDVPPKNAQRAAAIYEKTCKRHFEACNTYAEALRWGKLGKPDYARAARVYKKACDGGSVYGCGNLAALFEEGKAKPAAGEPGAVELYRASCDRNHKLSCLRFASMLARGDGVDRDEARAKALLERFVSPSVVAVMNGCCEDSPDCCSAAGFACAHGLGTGKDLKRGVELLRKGCDGGDGWGCARLKELPAAGKEGGASK